MPATRALIACALFATLSASVDAQVIARVSVDSNSNQGNDYSYRPRLSYDGRFIAFESLATNLVPGDKQSFQPDVFVHDALLGTTEIACVSMTAEENDGAFPDISSDGRYVVFQSNRKLTIDDTNTNVDLYRRDRQSATTLRVSLKSNGTQVHQDCLQPSISGDGNKLSFHSSANSFVVGDVNGAFDVFVRDIALGQTICASVTPNGVPGNAGSSESALSSDGRWVAFVSNATNLVPGHGAGVYRRDLLNGVTDFVADEGRFPTLSADGGTVVFQTFAALLPADVSPAIDVYLWRGLTNSLELVDVSSAGVLANNGTGLTASRCSISSDGYLVAFESQSTNLVPGDTNGQSDVFARDTLIGMTTRVSVTSTGVEGDIVSWAPAISGDRRTIAFASRATNFVAGDTNDSADVFLSSACFAPASYCSGATTSLGCVPMIRGLGSASSSAGSSFTLQVVGAESHRSGLFFYGLASTSQPFAVGNPSRLCVSAPRQRTTLMTTGTIGTCDGVLVLDWNAWIASHPNALGAPFDTGLTLFAQAWMRDNGLPGGSVLSNALEFVLCQ